MSLKAKIEAVIYASEEPVTLAQLTGLLGEEAQGELDAMASQQQSLALDDISVPDQDALNAETLNRGDDNNKDHAASGAESGAPELGPPALSTEPGAPGPGFPASALARGGGGLASETGEAEPARAAPEDKSFAAAARQKDRRLRDYFRSLLDQLIADYASEARGLEIREVAGGFRLATKPEYHDAVRGFVKGLKPPLKLSLQALETLAVVAYKQPVTSPEVSEIRGVDSAGVLGSLMARKLVTTAGRKQVIGRPILYKTTKDFLLRFGLKDINELPSIEEFEKMAGELNAAVQEEIAMEATPEERASAHIPVLDERNSAPRPSPTHHSSTDDLMSHKSTALKGRSTERLDTHQVPRGSQPERESQHEVESERRAEDGEDGEDEPEDVGDEAIVDGRISGPSPSYADDSPSAQEAREQQEDQDRE